MTRHFSGSRYQVLANLRSSSSSSRRQKLLEFTRDRKSSRSKTPVDRVSFRTRSYNQFNIWSIPCRPAAAASKLPAAAWKHWRHDSKDAEKQLLMLNQFSSARRLLQPATAQQSLIIAPDAYLRVHVRMYGNTSTPVLVSARHPSMAFQQTVMLASVTWPSVGTAGVHRCHCFKTNQSTNRAVSGLCVHDFCTYPATWVRVLGKTVLILTRKFSKADKPAR